MPAAVPEGLAEHRDADRRRDHRVDHRHRGQRRGQPCAPVGRLRQQQPAGRQDGDRRQIGPLGAPARRTELSATVLVNTEAMPKAVPAAAASSTLRSTGRCIGRAARNSTATAAAGHDDSTRSLARPATAPPARPRRSGPAGRRDRPSPSSRRARPSRRPGAVRRAPPSAGRRRWSARRAAGPGSAARRRAPRRAAARRGRSVRRPPTSRPVAAVRTARSGVVAATRSCTIAPPAYATAETSDSSTDSARALIRSTMPDPPALFLSPQVVIGHTPGVVREYAAWCLRMRKATVAVPLSHRSAPYGDEVLAVREDPGSGFGSGRLRSVQFPF